MPFTSPSLCDHLLCPYCWSMYNEIQDLYFATDRESWIVGIPIWLPLVVSKY